MPRPSAASRVRTVKASPAALRRLRGTDPVMARLVDEHATLVRRELEQERLGDAYGALLRSIVGQQLSTKAAATIYGRMIEIFGGHAPSPRQLLEADPDAIRAAGLSRPKIAYLRDLAVHVEQGALELDRLPELPDEEVVAQLTAIKGLGEWTAHMFLMFHLRRPDILPVGDQGIRRAVQAEYRLRKPPERERLEKLARPWRPHRTLACLLLWSSLDNKPA
ncbi:MAG TPA: DNA-3-methyladenine glycosylase [Thermoleophilaceae bacterium]|nr:DNA-3-methyladenine glycosylase [Thermoleophilaceae bacterium]